MVDAGFTQLIPAVRGSPEPIPHDIRDTVEGVKCLDLSLDEIRHEARSLPPARFTEKGFCKGHRDDPEHGRACGTEQRP